MTYDHWKTTNPEDAFLGPDPQEQGPEFWDTCPVCDGFGNKEVPRPQHDDPHFCVQVDCTECGGSGWVRVE